MSISFSILRDTTVTCCPETQSLHFRRTLLFLLLASALLPLHLVAQPAPGDSLRLHAQRLHQRSLVLDGHVDTPTKMLGGYDVRQRHGVRAGHLDLPRMAEGGLDGAFFALYVPPSMGETMRAFRYMARMRGEVIQQISAAPDAEMAYSAADVRRIAASGKRAVLLGLEGGHALAARPTLVDSLHALGIRYVTLTHINTNGWADASQAPPRWNGLNGLGRVMVREMNRTGIIVDLSHTSDDTFFDALEASRAPVLLSHSSCRALVDNVRNASDAMLRALAAHDGVILINFFDGMVNPHLTPDVMAEVHHRMGGRVGKLHDYWNVVYAVKRAHGLPGAALDDLLDHIDYAVKVAGIDHVGLGSDFDGVFDLPAGLEDVTRLPDITYGLLQRGYADADVRKILGGNLLRLMERVEDVSAGWARHEAPAR